MISFEIKDISIYPLKVKIAVLTKKNLNLTETNKRIQFYLEKNGDLELLDSTVFYSHNLPENPVHTDNLLEHGEVLYFNYFGADLYQGIKAKIIAVNSFSVMPFWTSEEIFLKTKQTELPPIEVDNHYKNGLISKIKINFVPEDDDKVKRNFLISQSIYEDGISLETILSTNTSSISANELTNTYAINKYGAYRIITKIYSSNLKELYSHHSYYSEPLGPLNITRKTVVPSDLEGEMNFAAREGKRGYYRKYGKIYRVTKIKVKL